VKLLKDTGHTGLRATHATTRVPLLVGHRVRFERMSVRVCVQQAAVCAWLSLFVAWQLYPAIGRVPEDESAGADAAQLFFGRSRVAGSVSFCCCCWQSDVMFVDGIRWLVKQL